MEKITAPEAQAAEQKALDAEVKETRVLNDGKRETTLAELREAGYISPNDRRIALAAKGGPDGKEVAGVPSEPVEKDVAKEKLVTKAVAEADKAAEPVNTDSAKVTAAKAKLSSK